MNDILLALFIQTTCNIFRKRTFQGSSQRCERQGFQVELLPNNTMAATEDGNKPMDKRSRAEMLLSEDLRQAWER